MTSVRPHPIAIFIVKMVHTAVFLVMLSSILWLVISGLLRRRDRTVAVAAGLVSIEGAVFLANDGVCPLTPLTERLGATRGTVSDIFLPDGIARTIPIWSTALVVAGVMFHVRSVVFEPSKTGQNMGTGVAQEEKRLRPHNQG